MQVFSNELFDLQSNFFRGHSYIESSHSLRQIDKGAWVGLALWR